ncbi:hypothetical protein SEA_RUDY_79 [Microbacterium phage Rudy]|uniref:Helix-turn-helix DNA binding domain protein n=1 Tax=Microbacterium phage Judebell TaxID=3230835 RepID=A0AAU8EGG8_9CAUD|nr:hypothetical protein SEA_CASEND_82 [Microbacterium phage Casend]QQO39261.1 hypothetical protein SEA_RUDY_79 [Microbacterium phage Rudy]QQO39590.1 hypothetical protein SEA_PHABIA_81 [Microbacterium phage Phabia]QWY80465.1 hypothetical protein SEA_TEEHEE_82 [Microbacterium phage Teehee]QWY80566.1 hypothetical protein SEA_QUAMMI_80 [Microbacterium phage Quammi]QXN73476.1 hypothetical protein SEA_JEHOSHAPHAT_83 [Microbacterium phage Jehoshaphat]UVG33925.1 hypothetical protein SEA_VICEROY_80 [M
MSDQPADDRSTQVDQAPTLGEMAEVMRGWQARGVTLASARYVIDKVFYKELAAEVEHATERVRALRAETLAAVATTIDKHSPNL